MGEHSGELLTSVGLVERVGWATALVSGMVADLLEAHWSAADGQVLGSGRDAGGRRLPSQAWMALRRLCWTVAPPVGVTVNDRVMRMAQEQAGRVLRSAIWRAKLTAAVLASWPADPAKRTAAEWDAVRERAPGGRVLASSVIKSRTRQVAAFERQQGRLPVDVFELEAAPRTASMLLLSACDRQQATIERGERRESGEGGGDLGRAMLRVQLPTRPDPRSYRDWAWVACPITLPPTIPPDAVLHLPTLRVLHGTVRADLAYTHPVPATRRAGHTVALGVDWGLNTLLSAGAARLHDDGTITTLGAGGMFRAGGVVAKQHRLRRLAEHLHTKAEQHGRLINDDEQHPLLAQQRVLREEIRRVSARRSHLNQALACSAARWAVDQAIAAGASVIYVEDLRSMEARGMGRTMNTRLSQQVRGQIVDRMRHLAAEAGIAAVTVPAKNTSKHCPRCLLPLRHRKAPDRPTTPGWKWAICDSCGYQGDRDTGAWQRIAARGLTHQNATATDPTSGAMAIRSVIDTLETRAVITPTATPKTDRRTGPRPAPPGVVPPAPRPGDAGHPPQHHPRVMPASVRRDTLTRIGPDCPAQPTETRA